MNRIKLAIADCMCENLNDELNTNSLSTVTIAMSRSAPPKIKRFPPAKQRLLDQLLEQNANGKISAKDQLKLQSLVAEAEELMVANSQRLADFAKSQSHPPVTAVPVTVWVNPEPAGR